MRYIISGKNLDITEGLRSAVTDKLGKLERYFTPDTEVHVTLSVEKERQKIEVTVDSPKADARHAGTNHRIQLVSRGVSLDLSQFLKNNHTLPSHTSLWL